MGISNIFWTFLEYADESGKLEGYQVLNSIIPIDAEQSIGTENLRYKNGYFGELNPTKLNFKNPSMLIYYGSPIGIEGTWDTNNASKIFAKYNLLVLGDGIGDPSYWSYDDTITIMEASKELNPKLKIYGYINIGVSSDNYSIAELEEKIDNWYDTGYINGIFVDEAGYDFEVTRDRQNAIIDYIHGKGLKVFINGWNPDDIFSSDVVATYNPTGTETTINPGDIYLDEDFLIDSDSYSANDNYKLGYDFYEKTQKVLEYRRTLGIELAGVGRLNYNDYTEQENNKFWRMLELGAIISSYDYYGLSDELFSSSGDYTDLVYPVKYDLVSYNNAYDIDLDYTFEEDWVDEEYWFRKAGFEIFLHDGSGNEKSFKDGNILNIYNTNNSFTGTQTFEDIVFTGTLNGFTFSDSEITSTTIWSADRINSSLTSITSSIGESNGIAPLDSDGLIPSIHIPLSLKEIVVNNITERDALTPEESTRAFVIDASDDPTVESGSAGYIYDGASWIKTYEQESLDLILSAENTSYDNSSSGLTGITVQEAIDELNTNIEDFNSDPSFGGTADFVSITFSGTINGMEFSDVGTTEFDIWSADKIITELSNKSLVEESGTNGNILVDGSELTVFDATGYAQINDSVTNSTDTWSSNKINTEIGNLIDDGTTDLGSTWSSTKIQDELDSIDIGTSLNIDDLYENTSGHGIDVHNKLNILDKIGIGVSDLTAPITISGIQRIEETGSLDTTNPASDTKYLEILKYDDGRGYVQSVQRNTDGSYEYERLVLSGSYVMIETGEAGSYATRFGISPTGFVTINESLSVGNSLLVDTILEKTADNGVSIDGVSLKDGGGVFTSSVDTGALKIKEGGSISNGTGFEIFYSGIQQIYFL